MDARIRAGNPRPAYFKLQEQLKNEIESGRLAPGERLLPEKKLAEIHQVSVGTATKAILNLVHAGYLYRVQGSGTFVSGSTLRFGRLRYYRFIKGFGGEEENLTIKLLNLKAEKGVEAINRHLQIDRTQGLFRLKRVLFSGRRATGLSISYLPQKMFRGLDKFPASRFEKVSLYTAIEESYGLPTILNREMLSAIPAGAEVARVLKVPEGTPILLVEMLAFTYKERPYEYRQSYCLTDEKKLFREY